MISVHILSHAKFDVNVRQPLHIQSCIVLVQSTHISFRYLLSSSPLADALAFPSSSMLLDVVDLWFASRAMLRRLTDGAVFILAAQDAPRDMKCKQNENCTSCQPVFSAKYAVDYLHSLGNLVFVCSGNLLVPRLRWNCGRTSVVLFLWILFLTIVDIRGKYWFIVDSQNTGYSS